MTMTTMTTMTFSPMLRQLLDLLLPRHCGICEERLNGNEDKICISCLTTLIHPTLLDNVDNEVTRQLWGEVPIQAGVTLCYYLKDEDVKGLFHAMKYRGRVDTCVKMGQLLASHFLPTGFFQDIDCIIPIPLSRQRQRKRGYNQSEHIAMGISDLTGIPVDAATLIRIVDNESQTHLSGIDRRRNVENVFGVQAASDFNGKHLLIIDDIITTGSTLGSAIATLHRAFPQATFSVASIAMTRR